MLRLSPRIPGLSKTVVSSACFDTAFVSHLEAEMDHIAVLHDVVFAFEPHFSYVPTA